MVSPVLRTDFVFKIILRTNKLMDQNMNKTVTDEQIADKRLIHTAASEGSAKKENKRPSTINNGAPGG